LTIKNAIIDFLEKKGYPCEISFIYQEIYGDPANDMDKFCLYILRVQQLADNNELWQIGFEESGVALVGLNKQEKPADPAEYLGLTKFDDGNVYFNK